MIGKITSIFAGRYIYLIAIALLAMVLSVISYCINDYRDTKRHNTELSMAIEQNNATIKQLVDDLNDVALQQNDDRERHKQAIAELKLFYEQELETIEANNAEIRAIQKLAEQDHGHVVPHSIIVAADSVRASLSTDRDRYIDK